MFPLDEIWDLQVGRTGQIYTCPGAQMSADNYVTGFEPVQWRFKLENSPFVENLQKISFANLVRGEILKNFEFCNPGKIGNFLNLYNQILFLIKDSAILL